MTLFGSLATSGFSSLGARREHIVSKAYKLLLVTPPKHPNHAYKTFCSRTQYARHQSMTGSMTGFHSHNKSMTGCQRSILAASRRPIFYRERGSQRKQRTHTRIGVATKRSLVYEVWGPPFQWSAPERAANLSSLGLLSGGGGPEIK